jgi:hypothetical protein
MHGRKKITPIEAVDEKRETAKQQLERLHVLQYRDMFNRIRDKVTWLI